MSALPPDQRAHDPNLLLPAGTIGAGTGMTLTANAPDIKPIPGSIEACQEEIRELDVEAARLKIDLSHNLSPHVAAPIRSRRADIQDRIAAIRAAVARMKSERHDSLMDAFYHAAHQVLDRDVLADVFDRLYEDHPEFERKPERKR
jgi:hypothetical protein